MADGTLVLLFLSKVVLGIIGGGNAPKVVKANIDEIKSLTDKPFWSEYHALSPFVSDIVDLVIEEGVKSSDNRCRNPESGIWLVFTKRVLQSFSSAKCCSR